MQTIDSNVHTEVPSIESLFSFLPELWVEQIHNTVFSGPTGDDDPYPRVLDVAIRPESRHNGGPPDLATLQQQALDAKVDAAISLCTYPVTGLHNPDQAVALARAVNDWQIAEWLEKDSRLRASIVVPSQIPSLAVAEIERVGDHPGFVQVALPVRAHHPYGNRLFYPMWEAIVKRDLVAGLYFGGAPGNPPSPVGWPSYFSEVFVDTAGIFATQLTNMVAEGLFDRFPEVRITLVESGVTWLPAHMWKFDKEWKNLRLQTPWVRKPPSAYIRDHVRLTTGPWDLPAEDKLALDMFEQLGSEEILLYSSGYPHTSVGNEDHLLSVLPKEAATKVKGSNAASWYRGMNGHPTATRSLS